MRSASPSRKWGTGATTSRGSIMNRPIAHSPAASISNSASYSHTRLGSRSYNCDKPDSIFVHWRMEFDNRHGPNCIGLAQRERLVRRNGETLSTPFRHERRTAVVRRYLPRYGVEDRPSVRDRRYGHRVRSTALLRHRENRSKRR